MCVDVSCVLSLRSGAVARSFWQTGTQKVLYVLYSKTQRSGGWKTPEIGFRSVARTECGILPSRVTPSWSSTRHAETIPNAGAQRCSTRRLPAAASRGSPRRGCTAQLARAAVLLWKGRTQTKTLIIFYFFLDFAHAFRYENCQNWCKNWGPLGMLTFCIAFTLSKEDGLARTPPRGWRSWNTFGSNVTQAKMEAIMDAMVRRDRSVDGVPTSLCDLGYCDGMRVCHLSCRP